MSFTLIIVVTLYGSDGLGWQGKFAAINQVNHLSQERCTDVANTLKKSSTNVKKVEAYCVEEGRWG